MEAPANTTIYMIAGYAVIFVVIFVYLASLVIRWRNLREEEAILEQVDADPEMSSDSPMQYESTGPDVKLL